MLWAVDTVLVGIEGAKFRPCRPDVSAEGNGGAKASGAGEVDLRLAVVGALGGTRHRQGRVRRSWSCRKPEPCGDGGDVLKGGRFAGSGQEQGSLLHLGTIGKCMWKTSCQPASRLA